MTAKFVLIRYVEAKTSTAHAATALNRLDAEINAVHHDAAALSEKERRAFYASKNLLAKTRQRERMESAYNSALAAEKAAREKWAKVAATMTTDQLRHLRMKF